MTHRHASLFGSRMRGRLYELNFLLNISIALILFYLGTYAVSIGIGETSFGYLMAIAALLSVPAYASVHAVTEVWGVRKALLFAVTLNTVSLFLIAYANSFVTLLIPVAGTFIAAAYIVCFLDAYVSENTSHGHNTGSVRGIFLAASNVAYIAAPAAAGLFAATMGYSSLFFIAGVCMFPFLYIVHRFLPDIRELKEAKRHNTHHAIRKILRTAQLREVFIAQALYRTFAIISAAYIGLYLTGSVGMTVAVMSIVLTCMEIPYVLVQVPLGKLIDGTWHEQTVAMFGFFILALTTTMIPLAVGVTSIVFWALLLFVQRIGGAMVELCLESFFFKHVQVVEQEEVAAFRSIYQITAVLGPAIAASLLFLGSYTAVFMCLSVLMVYGIYTSFQLES